VGALDLEKTRVLMAHGADVNAKSDDARTPLMIAAGGPAGAPIVRLLLAHGANPNPTRSPARNRRPCWRRLWPAMRKACRRCSKTAPNPKTSADLRWPSAAGADCTKCIDMLVARNLDAMQYTIALGQVAVLNNPG
jgi:hypothetical protein